MIFNSGDTPASITVSNGGLTLADSNTGTFNTARTDIGPTSGLYYVEFTITGNSTAGNSNGSVAVGVLPPVSQLQGIAGNPLGQFYYPWSGLVENNSATSTLEIVATANLTIDVALDLTHGKIWWRPNNGNWNNASTATQNPATNTGGVSFTPSALGTMFGGCLISTAVGLTANFGATAYTRTPPAGFGACPASGVGSNAMYWNSADTHAGVTPYDQALNALSNVQTSGAWSSMRSKPSFSAAGKWYWEVTFLNTPSNLVIVGAMNATATLANLAGFDTHGVGQQSSGPTFYNNASAGASGAAAVSGDVMGIAIDGTNSKMWSRLNAGGWFNAAIGSQNPATNTGGAACAGLFTGGNVMAAISFFGEKLVVLANFGQTAFANAAPSGFASPFSSVPNTSASNFFFRKTMKGTRKTRLIMPPPIVVPPTPSLLRL